MPLPHLAAALNCSAASVEKQTLIGKVSPSRTFIGSAANVVFGLEAVIHRDAREIPLSGVYAKVRERDQMTQRMEALV